VLERKRSINSNKKRAFCSFLPLVLIHLHYEKEKIQDNGEIGTHS
jgi:hypothetical protein